MELRVGFFRNAKTAGISLKSNDVSCCDCFGPTAFVKKRSAGNTAPALVEGIRPRHLNPKSEGFESVLN
jgi:hypothetical protein